MHPRVEISSQAQRDLIQIARYISRDNPQAAEGFNDKLLDAAYSLKKAPLMGAVIAERPGVRMIVCHPYLIFYTIEKARSRIDILRFWHGARDLKNLRL